LLDLVAHMLTLALAVVIGVALGMLGGGGSILTVPVFTYVAGLDPKIAIASSLPVIAVASTIGAIGHWRAGSVQLRTAALFGGFTMIGGFSGARLAGFLPARAQLLLFAAIMLGAAASMFRSQGVPVTDTPTEPLALGTLLPLGLGVGVLTGLVGVGGGFLIVPALTQLGRLPMHIAIGTSLTVIAMNSLAGTLGYLGQVPLPYQLLIPFTTLAVVGIVAGTLLARRVRQQSLRRAFAVLLVLVAGYIVYQNRPQPAVTASSFVSNRQEA
jgi:uncharacterized protein